MAHDSNLKIDLNKRYTTIFSREEALARAVAHAVIKARPVSAWEVLVPILLVFSFAKSREIKEVFVQNFLFTKQLALKEARDMIRLGRSREEALARVEEQTRNLLASVQKGLYSEAVRLKQIAEIDLLLDHYLRIFRAEGGDFEEWVANAYVNIGNYVAFQERLKHAEREVYLAAVNTVGSQDSADRAARMEEATENARRKAAERIFTVCHSWS